jgi:hypothetical protein
MKPKKLSHTKQPINIHKMSNNVKILYNNKDAFSGISNVPFVSISNDYIDFGVKWNQVTNITLEGQLTGKFVGAPSYNLLNEAAKKLHENFSENYKTLLITENDSGIYSGTNAIINSINIEQSSWYGILPYSIDITIYDSGLFKDYYGIVEPEETFSFEEEEGDILNLTHSLSAKGIIAKNKNAIQNAKDWVLSRTGNINNISPILIKNSQLFESRPYLLYSTREVVDRFNGTYSWEGNYKKSTNLENPNNSILNYSIDLNSGIEDGIVTASIDGNLEGNNLTILRTDYNNLDLYALCNQASSKIIGEPLSNRPISQFIRENSEENRLDFNSTYNNDYSDQIINNSTVDINEDSLKCIRTVNLDSRISCKYGDITTRWQKVNEFYKNKFFPYSLASEEYLSEFGAADLNPLPLTESITFDQFNAQITYNAQYSNKTIIFSADILNISSNVTFIPSIFIHAANTSAFTPREHNIQNLRCANRSSLQISVNATAKMNKNISIAENAAQSEVNRIKSNYTNGRANLLLEDRLVNKNNDIKTVTINETWTFDGPLIS